MFYFQIDCNSYFASCEIATRSGIEGKPLVVANDNENGGGVILALNTEAKQVGLKRGVPLFKVREMIKRNEVIVCKADHKKYRRISHTIMEAVQQQGIVLNFVQYSVDEFFGTLPIDDPAEARYYARKVMDCIWEVSHVPVGCGISLTNTLAKTATWFAKRYKGFEGICVITEPQRERALSLISVGDIWGIGRKQRARLEAIGIRTALDFARCDERQVANLLNTAGLRTWRELRGEPAIVLQAHTLQKSIMQSHTFAVMTTEYRDLEIAVAGFTTRCASSLRKQQGLCSVVTVFVATNRFRQDLLQYRNHISSRLPRPSADTSLLLKVTRQLLGQIYRQGYHYKQAGVILSGIVPDNNRQLDLFSAEQDERQRKLMAIADDINRRFGDNSISFGDSSSPHTTDTLQPSSPLAQDETDPPLDDI